MELNQESNEQVNIAEQEHINSDINQNSETTGNIKPSNDVVFQDVPAKKSSKTGIILGFVLLALIAAGGVGFGVWAMMDGQTQREQLTVKIEDLQKQNDELKENVENETEGKSDQSEAKIGFLADSADTLEYPEYATMEVASVAYARNIYSLSLNGDVEVYNAENQLEKHILTEKIPGRVVDIVTGSVTNGNIGVVLFLLEDGRIAYAYESDISSEDVTFEIVKEANDIINIYGDLHNISRAGYAQDRNGNLYALNTEEANVERSPIVLKK